jgi:gibberellin 20-oxidase
MKKLSQVILELLAISLGVDQLHYKKFFEDAETMMRCNSYPPCSGINVGTLGTGPHCDPTSVTISGGARTLAQRCKFLINILIIHYV